MDGLDISYIDRTDLDRTCPVEIQRRTESSYLGYKSTMVRHRGFSVVALVNPKNPINIGSVMRAAGCYSASLVVIGGPRPQRLSGLSTDPQKAHRHIPHIMVDNVFDAIPYNCVPVAIDLLPDAKPLCMYSHPERAFYIFGAEDATLGKAIIDRCRDKVYIPTNYCMNLAATVNVVLYDRMAKRGTRWSGGES